MTFINAFLCRKSRMIIAFLLLLQSTFAQSSFNKAGEWLKDNIGELGGRAVLVIWKDGKIVYNKAENEMNNKQKMITKFIARRQGKDPAEVMKDFNSVTKEPIASCSKWLSAALAMTFVDEGKLNVNDSIGKFLPVMTTNGKGNIRIWQCLSHLTGIKTPSLKDTRELTNKANSMEDAINNIALLPMEGEPGKTFHYSSAGLQIVAAVLENLGGKNFETLFHDRIAVPCGMKDTDFGNGNVALAAGSARSSAEDYLNFLVMILNDGKYMGKQVLSRQSVFEMQRNRVTKDVTITYTPAEAGDWGYGFGEWVMDNPVMSTPLAGGIPGSERSTGVTSPGLFGSFPWVENKLHYAGFLFTFNIRTKGRNERYKELKKIIDDALRAN